MSRWPSLSTSKTPAASNSLRPLIVCGFHLGSSAPTDAVVAKATIVQAVRRARGRVMGLLRVALGRGGQCPTGGRLSSVGIAHPTRHLAASLSDGGQRPGLA